MEEQLITDKKPPEWPQIDTVLVVDDDESWCFVTKMILQKSGVGKRVITASNGQEAIKTLQSMGASYRK